MKLYAFWRHSGYPPHFMVGGEIIKFNNDGTVEVKGYGKGYSFKPEKILPLETGLILSKQLNDLHASYNSEIGKVQEKYKLLFKDKFGKIFG